jgi:hypothetical protein
MNKAAFLNIVRQVAPIQDQEVDDLERLVVSFPYCQTAHVLLAKAAHDRGSMLSTQKLRRAAAHVSNRQLLKQLVYASPYKEEEVDVLLEEPEEEVVQEEDLSLTPVSEAFAEKETPTTAAADEEVNTDDIEEEDPAEDQESDLTESEDEELDLQLDSGIYPEDAILASLLELDTLETLEEEYPSDLEDDSDEPQVEDSFVEETAQTEVPSFEEEAVPEETEVAELGVIDSAQEVENPDEETSLPETEKQDDILPIASTETESFRNQVLINEHVEEEVELADVELAAELNEEEDSLDELLALIQIDGLSSISAPYPSVNLSHEEIISELTSSQEDFTNAEPITILTGNDDLDVGGYLEIAQLDSLYDTSGYEFPTLKLPSLPAQDTVDETAQDPYLAIFTQNNLAYWMGSSRLGESIQLKDELTSATPFYFQPELILEHVKEKNEPAAVPEPAPIARLDVQLNIIDQFLKSAPKRKTLANAQLSHEPQEDLSAKSSKIKKSLVSENLALILHKQGKVKKAIKIYEQLIVRFPEKKSYFAEQIEKLRNE